MHHTQASIPATEHSSIKRRENPRPRWWAALAATIGIIASGSLAAAVPAAAADTVADGCSYGTGGPLASSLCWIDMSAFGTVSGDEVRGNTIVKPMSVSIGGYTVSFTVSVSANEAGSVGFTAASFGSDIWSRAILGNTIDGVPYYTGTTGLPALYQLADATSPYAVPGERETVELTNITVTDPQGQPITDYSMVMTDAESTNASEGFEWSSDAALNLLQEVIPAGGNSLTGNDDAPYGQPCDATLSGFGTTTVTCASSLLPGETSRSARGIVMVEAEAPTTISAQITGRGGSGRQGIAFAIALPPRTGDEQAVINPNETATLSPVAYPGTKPLSSVTFDGGEATKVVPGEGTWTITLVDGQPVATFTPENDYHGPVTPQPYTVTDAGGSTATATLTVTINTPPATADEHATINPNQTATLHPTTTPGTAPITAVAFDNGETTKTVPGEGTWTITLVDGQPVATFTPENDYHGPVTPQPYTVTDTNGLTATGTLTITITINTPPATGTTGTPRAVGAAVNTGGSVSPGAAWSAGWGLTSVAGALLLSAAGMLMWRRRRDERA